MIAHKAGVRRAFLVAGSAAFLVSLTLLFYSFAKARHISGYLAQADAAYPFVQKGILTAVCATVLCLLGKGVVRIITALMSCTLLLYWLFLGATLY